MPRRSIAFFSSGSSLSFSARDDGLRDLVLQGEDVGQVAVVAVGPDVVAGRAVDQLGGDPHPAAGLAHAAFEHVADAELARHLGQTSTDLALEREGGVARDHDQRRDLRQVGDDVLADAVAEILLLGIAAHVGERQHADRDSCAASALRPGAARAAAGPDQRGDAGHDLAPARRCRARRSSRLRSAHWIWSNGIGGMVPSTLSCTSVPRCARGSASARTHCDFTASADQITTTALAALSRSSITSA